MTLTESLVCCVSKLDHLDLHFMGQYILYTVSILFKYEHILICVFLFIDQLISSTTLLDCGEVLPWFKLIRALV